MIFFARRLMAADGTFAGATAAAIAVDDLQKFYGSIAKDSETKITLSGNDGLILAQYPPEGIDGQVPPSAAPLPNLQGERNTLKNTGGVNLVSDVADRSSLLFLHPVEAYPLTIAIRVPKSEVFALWRKHTTGTSAAALAVVICLGALFTLLNRHMTKTMQAETALRSSQEVLDGILNAIPVRVFWKDMDLRYLGCNMAFARDAGRPSPLDLIGKSDYDMVWKDQADLYRADDRRVIESGQSKLLIEEPQTTPEGRTITLLTSKIPLRGKDEGVNGVLGTYMDITEKREAEATIAHLARHDALTGLPNRLLFRETLDRTLAHARMGQLLALHCLDLDQFKDVNDTLGHPVGDGLLRAVAERLEDSLRETDFVARLGGDEFAVVQTMLDSSDGATDLANRLVTCLKTPFEIDGHHLLSSRQLGRHPNGYMESHAHASESGVSSYLPTTE
jgi:diguanylate cyclase (GGDEF)-like protein/PAS domain S-box-containing protein